MTSWCVFDVAGHEKRIAELEARSAGPGFWNDNQKAQEVMRELSGLKDESTAWTAISRRIADGLELAALDDPSLEAELTAEVEAIEADVTQLEFETMLSGEFDRHDAILSIYAGAGGTDSQDFAAMLLRMYLRWAEYHKFKTEIVDSTDGEEAGLKSVTVGVNGKHAYGYLKAEKGVHRLVRLSPFDSAHRRHTSFAGVEVYPAVEEDDEVQVNPNDLKIETYRASSAGGQNVQKNETAISITHVPTGIVVTCQNERSQTQNRANALKVLRAKLLDRQREEREKELAAFKGTHVKAEWGSQIRSYVLHPYQMVKDHRTDYETGNTAAVLDGRLDEFMEAYLRAAPAEPAA